MGDLFDEFMKELRRRQAEAAGERVPDDAGDGPPDAERDADADADGDPERDGDAEPAEDETQPSAADSNGADDEGGPIPLRRPGRTRDRETPPPGRRPGGPGSGRPPRPPRRRGPGSGGPRDGAPSLRSRVTTVVAVVVAAFIALMLFVGIQLWTDAIWYRSVGFDAVFWTRLGVQAGLFGLGFVVAAGALYGNLWLAGRLAPPTRPREGGTLRGWIDRLNEAAATSDRGPRGPWTRWDPGASDARPIVVGPDEFPDPVPIGRTVIAIVAFFAALTIASSVSGAWETIVLWQNRVPFDPTGTPVVDPVFGRDISFFLFELPFLRLVQTIATGLLVAALVVAAARYLVAGLAGAAVFDTRVRVHLAVIAGLILLSIALGYQLDKFELVHSTRGVATGVSYTDENAQFFAYNALTVLSALAAALLVGGAFARVLWPVGLTFGVWFLASLVVGRAYPFLVERFTVVPNQLQQEARYIGNNIAMTRLAFGLTGFADRAYPGNAAITSDVIADDAETFQNARLWDYRPLGDTLDQLQTVRTFYDFVDVDTDRYEINGQLRQVMLSARELALDKSSTTVPSWVNQRIVYTHGMGAAMVPVNAVVSQGQPQLLISDVPPVSTGGAPAISQPRIYFGERPSSYVIVGARQPEFDYLRGDAGPSAPGGSPSPLPSPTDVAGGEIVPTTWTGHTGIPLGTTLDRLLFALRFRDVDLLISDQVTAQSQLLMNRSIDQRLPLIAPFLKLDKDPYLVIDGSGNLVYVQDAFTTSDLFPHAQPFDPRTLPRTPDRPTGFGSDPFNYVRNSVKITMNAYDGTMTLYVADPSDPLIRAWEGVFPTLFKPISQLPADLAAHLRVPEELFDVQTRVFGTYHVTDPATFFFKNDLWEVPSAVANEQSLPNEAYYVVMRTPGSDAAEFLLLQPMVPKGRPNMIAWVAVRNDPGGYGQTTVFRFPNQSTIFGPVQIEAQIDADPVISAQITLWNQSGSKVVRGNLIVVPVGDSLLYLQPVYLQSQSSKFPAFQRIVVASPRNIVWGSSLQEALNLLLEREAAGGPGGPSPSPTPTPTPTPSPSAGPGGSPGPSPAPGETIPPGATVQQIVAYANAHMELAQNALRQGDFATYGSEIELVRQALAQLTILTR